MHVNERDTQCVVVQAPAISVVNSSGWSLLSHAPGLGPQQAGKNDVFSVQPAVSSDMNMAKRGTRRAIDLVQRVWQFRWQLASNTRGDSA
jgi:hypothetical protein